MSWKLLGPGMDATPDWSMYIIKDLSEPWEVPATGDIGGSSKDNICGLTSEKEHKLKNLIT